MNGLSIWLHAAAFLMLRAIEAIALLSAGFFARDAHSTLSWVIAGVIAIVPVVCAEILIRWLGPKHRQLLRGSLSQLRAKFLSRPHTAFLLLLRVTEASSLFLAGFLSGDADSTLKWIIAGVIAIVPVVVAEIFIHRLNAGRQEFLTEPEVQKRLRDFSQDATKIMLIAGDAQFLKKGDIQHEELKRRGEACEVLLAENHKVDHGSLRELIAAGVRIRRYRGGTPANLRGRLKQSDSGKSACLFDRDQGLFRVMTITNYVLVELVFAEYDRWFKHGRNAEVNHILLNVGGVVFDGDVRDFFERVETRLNVRVDAKWDDHTMVDPDLDLGLCDIVSVLRERASLKTLSQPEEDGIRRLWQETWMPNQAMLELATNLKSAGYTVSACSNCDRANADHYHTRGYFDVFDHVFLSCNMGCLKPSSDYFTHILNEMDARAPELLIIDDSDETVLDARALGMKAVLMPRMASDDKVPWLKKQLTEHSIRPAGRG